ncbi:hypothetical protein PR048_017448 [Dryococelus australis]|uniref:Uncharacterized protein n=1 Tax=Dryococelus australis TaxID=614101 RepID=A0ABQ9H9R1_9NEOP|nr:hypothetical protein PR048_017448 [Dryococelus australis]
MSVDAVQRRMAGNHTSNSPHLKYSMQIQEGSEFKSSRCNSSHKRRECPAWAKSATMGCKIRLLRQVHVNQSGDENDCFQLLSFRVVKLDTVYTSDKHLEQGGIRSKRRHEWRERVTIEDRYANVMPIETFKRIDRQLNGGAKLKPVGVWDTRKCIWIFYVVDLKFTPLLGLSGCSDLGFVKDVHMLTSHKQKVNLFMNIMMYLLG